MLDNEPNDTTTPDAAGDSAGRTTRRVTKKTTAKTTAPRKRATRKTAAADSAPAGTAGETSQPTEPTLVDVPGGASAQTGGDETSGTKRSRRRRTTESADTAAAAEAGGTAPAEAAVSTQSDAESADPAPAPVKRTRKATAKAPAKKAAKTAVKRTTRKTTASTGETGPGADGSADDAELGDGASVSLADGGPVTAAGAGATGNADAAAPDARDDDAAAGRTRRRSTVRKTAGSRTRKTAAAGDLPAAGESAESAGLSIDDPATAGRSAGRAGRQAAGDQALEGTPAGSSAVADRADQASGDAADGRAKKTTRRRTAKKAAQPDLLTADSAVTDGPVADTELPDEELLDEELLEDGVLLDEPEDEAAGGITAGDSETGDGTATGDGPRRRRGRRSRSADGGAPEASDAEAAPDGRSGADAADGGSGDGGRRRRGRRDRSTGDTQLVGAPEGAELPTDDEAPAPRRGRKRAAATTPLFQAPVEVAPQAAATSPVEATPETAAESETTRPKRSRRGVRKADAEQIAQSDDGQDTTAAAAEETEEAEPTTRRRRSRRGRDAEEVAADRAEPVLEAARETTADSATDTDAIGSDADADDDSDDNGDGGRRRRRRRGGRRRRKSGEGADDSTDEHADDDSDDAADEPGDAGDTDGAAEDDESGSSSRRRRRRRRRKGEDGGGAADDPDETVVRVREPRGKNTANEITAVEGSTRLEAKKQRRREGRAAGRRRAPIVTEAEFLARRESVERTMVIRAREDLTQIAVSEDNVLVEHYVAAAEQTSLIGNVYLGRVQNVLPSMEAAFIDIGKGRNAVLYAGEVDWTSLGAANGPRRIEAVLKSGQPVLVQVTKDPIGHKGARLTNQISLPGRYVVYVPRGGNGGISRKLPDTERNRLKTILKDIVPDEAGVIVRTAAEGASEQELTADVSRLQGYWTEIERLSKSGQAPKLLHGEPDLLIRVVRDLFTEDFAQLVVSGEEAHEQVREYVASVAPHLADRVEQWTPAEDGSRDVFANFRIDEQIRKALDRKVWLPSGGSLIIDRTEAMTVVDVNTGKFTGSGGNLEETVTRNNLEAAEEIVRQLRLRDLGGIIVIDFIDMVLESNRDLVLRRLVECLGRDRTKHQVAEVTSLGLVQMTRKRIGTGLLEAFSENCDHCGGRGLLLHDEPKESRRRDGGRGHDHGGRGGGSDHGGRQSGNGNSNGHGNGGGQNGQQSQNGQNGDGSGGNGSNGQAEGGGRRSRRRGRGRADEEQVESAPQHNGDAAQHLAQIAAASKKATDSGDLTEPAADGPALDDVATATDEVKAVAGTPASAGSASSGSPAVVAGEPAAAHGSMVKIGLTTTGSSAVVSGSAKASVVTSGTATSGGAGASGPVTGRSAASGPAAGGDGVTTPTGYPGAAVEVGHDSPEATGFPVASEAAPITTVAEGSTPVGSRNGADPGHGEAASAGEAEPAGEADAEGAARSGRRRRSSRGRGRGGRDQQDQQEQQQGQGGGDAGADELVRTGG